MRQIQHKIFDQIEDTFASAIRYYDGFVDGQKAQVKENFKLIEFGKEIKKTSPTKKEIQVKIKNMYHRKDGRWEYSATKNKEKVYLIASTQEKLYQKIKELKKPSVPSTAKLKHITLIEWANYWLSTYKSDVSKGTISSYNVCINYHMKPYFKNALLKDVTPMMVQEFLSNLSPGTRTQEFAYITIKQILRYAFVNQKTKINLSETIYKPKRVRGEKKTALSMDEQKRFLEQLKSYDEDIQYFMIFSLIAGTRRTETKNFCLNDMEFEKLRLHIRGTKTEHSDRKIIISQNFADFLRSKKVKEPYFKRMPSFYTKTALEIFQKADIHNKRLHDLRHTCSTNLFYLGWADVERQQYLGHASIIMTNDIYTNLQEDITKDEVVKLYNNLYISK